MTQTERGPGYRAVRQVAVLDVAKVQDFVQTHDAVGTNDTVDVLVNDTDGNISIGTI